MISEKVILFLKESGWYDATEDKLYEEALSALGIILSSDFAIFNLKTNAMTFPGKRGSIYNVCWFYLNSRKGIFRSTVLKQRVDISMIESLVK